jgi:hypothetical protein
MELCRNARALRGSPKRRRQSGHSRSRFDLDRIALRTLWAPKVIKPERRLAGRARGRRSHNV